jgi:hypothetical protein
MNNVATFKYVECGRDHAVNEVEYVCGSCAGREAEARLACGSRRPSKEVAKRSSKEGRAVRILQRGKVFPALLFALLSPALGAAQEEHQHHESGEQVGKVNFVVSCSPQAQRQFNLAVAWLHSFEYGESERAFNKVAAIDPQCAMAHWGIAMSQYHQLWAPPGRAELEKGALAVQRAEAIGAKTNRERDYIDAIAQFYGDWERSDHPARASRYERAMERLYERYPSDREAGVEQGLRACHLKTIS